MDGTNLISNIKLSIRDEVTETDANQHHDMPVK